jgi:hypothetical protein
MFEDKNVLIGIAFWLLAALFIVLRLKRPDELQKARLDGMRQVVGIMARWGSYYYERAGEPLPDAVTKALDYLDSALEHESPKRRADHYAIGAGMLADAMGAAAARRGAQEEALGRQ